jgi:hypothetical protein
MSRLADNGHGGAPSRQDAQDAATSNTVLMRDESENDSTPNSLDERITLVNISTPTKQKDPIIAALLATRGPILDVSESAEEERQRRMYVMLRWSHKYKKMQVESANAMWAKGCGGGMLDGDVLQGSGAGVSIGTLAGAKSTESTRSLADMLAEAGDLDSIEDNDALNTGTGRIKSDGTSGLVGSARTCNGDGEIQHVEQEIYSKECRLTQRRARSMTCDVLLQNEEPGCVAGVAKRTRKRCVTFAEEMSLLTSVMDMNFKVQEPQHTIPHGRFEVDAKDYRSPSEVTLVKFQL